jgi:hypothetical protein
MIVHVQWVIIAFLVGLLMGCEVQYRKDKKRGMK